MADTLEIILVVFLLSFWLLFPIGMFLSVGRIDKNTDEIERFEEEHETLKNNEEDFKPVPFDWHHPVIYFKRWLQHE